jgi:hypothetical protein
MSCDARFRDVSRHLRGGARHSTAFYDLRKHVPDGNVVVGGSSGRAWQRITLMFRRLEHLPVDVLK